MCKIAQHSYFAHGTKSLLVFRFGCRIKSIVDQLRNIISMSFHAQCKIMKVGSFAQCAK